MNVSLPDGSTPWADPILIYTVSELTEKIKERLESDWPEVWVEGEATNAHLSKAGHLYFTLKDQTSQIRVVMFRPAAQSLRFSLEEGLLVIAFGHLSVYPPRGEYQLVTEHLEPKGWGALQLAFEQLKRKLEGEGFFDLERKRPLPFCPRRIGIVTSPTGAAIHDMLTVLARKFPDLEILIAPVNVQGREAAPEIAQAIRNLNREELDLLIVGRGGGSIEDLWAFNEEVVARAIFESRVPVLSAVGHETDFTIADFVADLRAPTPSAAAEMAVPARSDLLQKIEELRQRLGRAIRDEIEEKGLLVQRWVAALRDPASRLEERIAAFASRLEALSPTSVLERGYAIAFDSKGRVLRGAHHVDLGDAVKIRLARGGLETVVTKRL